MLSFLFRAALLPIFAASVFTTQAEADHRPRYKRDRGYYEEMPYYYPQRYFRYFYIPREEYRDDEFEEFDEGYYDPSMEPPVVKRKPAAKKKTVFKEPAKKAPVKKMAAVENPPLNPAAKPPSAAGKKVTAVETPREAPVTPSGAKPVKKAAPAAKPAAGALSCDKATGIVTGFGFTDVKPAVCTGQFYTFNAARDGRPFTIKLNARSGELTEVKKVQ